MKRSVRYVVFMLMAGMIIPMFIGKAFTFPETINERLDLLFGEGASRRYEPFIRAFQDAVRQNDPVKVSNFIQYPIVVRLDNRKVKLNSEKDFIKYYSKIFTLQMRATVINQAYETIFSNWQGVMFGSGAIWIAEIFPDPKSSETLLKVTAINMEVVERQ